MRKLQAPAVVCKLEMQVLSTSGHELPTRKVSTLSLQNLLLRQYGLTLKPWILRLGAR